MITPLPDALRAAYLASRAELAQLTRTLEALRQHADKLHQPPKASKRRSAAHPITGGTRVPIWYSNQPDHALAQFGGERGKSFVLTLRDDAQMSHERRSRPQARQHKRKSKGA